MTAALLTKLLLVRYKGGNEYLALDKLYEALQEVGKVTAFVFRGRGTNPAELPVLEAHVSIDKMFYRLVYFLP